MIERTLVLLKPDCVMRQFVGEVITRFEKAGYKIIAMKMVWNERDFFKKHYYDVAERHSQKVLEMNINAMHSGPIIALILEGVNAIENVRKMIGPTEPKKALPGTIRGDYSHSTYALADSKNVALRNIIHASADEKDARLEIDLWFKKDEIFDYKTVHEAFFAHEKTHDIKE